MKKYIPFVVVLALVLAVVGVAKSNSVWADASSESAVPVEYAPSIVLRDPAELNAEPSSITIEGSGTYNVGGFCNLEVEYKLDSGLKDEADVEVPTDYSAMLPFGYEGDLYLPGCHLVHFKNNEIVREVSAEDGSWKVCFAERPNVELTVYYYLDEPFEDSPFWIELETTHDDGFACAFAPYTGEYAPGSKVEEEIRVTTTTITTVEETQGDGTVKPPPPVITVTESSTYSVGGICTFTVIYTEPDQSDEIHVADALRHESDPVDDYDSNQYDPFPDSDALLYLPGCHVLHYKFDDITRYEKFPPQGEWKICFAARPDKDMTIYYYLGDEENQGSSWTPLETTVENGMACAPAFFTGVYVPTGK